jgi:hypothetical protein
VRGRTGLDLTIGLDGDGPEEAGIKELGAGGAARAVLHGDMGIRWTGEAGEESSDPEEDRRRRLRGKGVRIGIL